MKVWLKADDTEAEITVKAPFNPDVLTDICHRVAELVITAEIGTWIATADVEVEEDPSEAS